MRPLLPPRHCSRWIFDTHRVPDERVFRLENSSTRLLPVPEPLRVVRRTVLRCEQLEESSDEALHSRHPCEEIRP